MSLTHRQLGWQYHAWLRKNTLQAYVACHVIDDTKKTGSDVSELIIRKSHN